MTIIAGFKSHEGIVICADTQETREPTKRQVHKVRVEPPTGSIQRIMGNINISAAFCGSGNGPFLDMLIEKAWSAAKSAQTLDDACAEIEQEIKRVYQEYGMIYQQGDCPFVEIIYGVKGDGDSRLFLASGPAIVEKRGYETAGIGSYLANYLASRMYGESLNLYQCVILAAYVLLQAKNHVEGCGGESHIAVLQNSGECGLIEGRRVETLTNLVDSADRTLGPVLLRSADLTAGDELVERAIADYALNLNLLRSHASDSIGRWDEFWQGVVRAYDASLGLRRDRFGFTEEIRDDA